MATAAANQPRRPPFFSGKAALLCLGGLVAVLLLDGLVKVLLADRLAWSSGGSELAMGGAAVPLLIVLGFLAGSAAQKLCLTETVLTALVAIGIGEYPLVATSWFHQPWALAIDPQIYQLDVLVVGAGVGLCIFLGTSLGFMLAGGGELDLGLRYELFVALTFLKLRGSTKDGRLSPSAVVTGIAILAVVIGMMALTVVLSVMSGFEGDLKRKILGTNAHAVVMKYGNDFREYPEVRAKILKVAGVIGATPFTLNEVMLSSDDNISGVVIKGIDPTTVASVTDLAKEVVEGDLKWLTDPAQIPIEPEADAAGLTQRIDKLLAKERAERGGDDGDEAGIEREPVKQGNPTPPAPPVGPQGGAANAAPIGSRQGLAPPGKTTPPAQGLAPPGKTTPPAQGLAPPGKTTPPAQGLAPPTKPSGPVLPGIVLGRELAKTLRVFVGDKVNVVSPLSNELGPSGPIPKSRPFRVAAVFYSGFYEYDAKFGYLALPEAQKFFSTEGTVTGVELKVEDLDATRRIIRDIVFSLDGYPFHAKDWGEMNKNLFAALAMEKLVMAIILGFASLPVGFLILAILMFLAFEKSQEIAVLKSMGARDQSVMKIFVLEGLIIGGIGAAVGLLAGLGVCLFIAKGGIKLDPSVYYIETLPVKIESWQFAVVGLSALLLSYLATMFPALAASRLAPVDGLRNE